MSNRDAPARDAFAVFRPVPARWRDNDIYGHVNNVVFYEYFDTAVNAHLIENGMLDHTGGDVIGLVVESGCSYYRPTTFPTPLEAGIAVARLGRSSVVYRVGIFDAQEDAKETALAAGTFVHVYVNRESRKPVELPAALRAGLEPLVRD